MLEPRKPGTASHESADTCEEKMRVLYFAPKECWPPDTGAKLRNFHLARELAQRSRVTYLGFADTGGAAPDQGHGPDRFCESVISVPREAGYSLGKLIRGALGPIPVTLLNYTTRAMHAELHRLLATRDFDVVQMEGLHLLEYLPMIRSVRNRPLVICDWHNVDSGLIRQYSERAPTPWRRAYARLTARRMSEIEREAMLKFDAHVVVSEADRARLLDIEPSARVFIVDNGVDVGHYSDEEIERAHAKWRSRAAAVKRVLFVGSMDYHANVDAAVHFARDVWPSVYSSDRNLVFTIVGRNPSDAVRELAHLDGVEVTGTVEDVRPYYREAAAAVVPLRIGGGSRLKILEAMAAGVPVISTCLGAEGIDAVDGENILIAEGADELTRAIRRAIHHGELRQRLVASARSLVRSRYDWSEIGARLFDIHRGLKRGADKSEAEPVGARRTALEVNA